MEKCRVSNQRVEHLQDQMDDMKKQMAEMRQLYLSSQGQRAETNSTPGNESNTHENIRTREAINTEKGDAILEEVAESNASMQNDETLTGRRIVHVEKHNRQQGGGRDVILSRITRPLNVVVAKGTIQTTNPKACGGGEPLGSQYVEIFIYSVFKRGTQLPHPYGNVLTMGDAKGKSIAWPPAMVLSHLALNVRRTWSIMEHTYGYSQYFGSQLQSCYEFNVCFGPFGASIVVE